MIVELAKYQNTLNRHLALLPSQSDRERAEYYNTKIAPDREEQKRKKEQEKLEAQRRE